MNIAALSKVILKIVPEEKIIETGLTFCNLIVNRLSYRKCIDSVAGSIDDKDQVYNTIKDIDSLEFSDFSETRASSAVNLLLSLLDDVDPLVEKINSFLFSKNGNVSKYLNDNIFKDPENFRVIVKSFLIIMFDILYFKTDPKSIASVIDRAPVVIDLLERCNIITENNELVTEYLTSIVSFVSYIEDIDDIVEDKIVPFLTKIHTFDDDRDVPKAVNVFCDVVEMITNLLKRIFVRSSNKKISDMNKD